MPADADLMFTYVYAPDISGDNGLLCAVEAAEMADDGQGGLTAPLVDADAEAAMLDSGIPVTSVSVAYYNVVYSDLFFPDANRPIPIQAGRMFTVGATDLGI
jgi:hypothetical protein